MVTWNLKTPQSPHLLQKDKWIWFEYNVRISQQAENLLKSNEEIKIATRRTAKCLQSEYYKIQRFRLEDKIQNKIL